MLCIASYSRGTVNSRPAYNLDLACDGLLELASRTGVASEVTRRGAHTVTLLLNTANATRKEPN
jgi:hypothetical protein